MTDEPTFVTVTVAANSVLAGMVKSQLEAADIPVYVVGGLLLDEFAKAQEAFGNSGVEVQVPSDRLDEAKEILEACRLAAEHGQDGDDGD